MPKLRIKLYHEPCPHIIQQRLNNYPNSPPIHPLGGIGDPDRQKHAADTKRECVHDVAGWLPGDAAETLTVEFLEDGGGDLDGDDEAVVWAVLDYPAVTACDIYGSWVGRPAFGEGIYRGLNVDGRRGKSWRDMIVIEWKLRWSLVHRIRVEGGCYRYRS